MFGFIKRVLNFALSKVKYSKQVDFSYSVVIGKNSTFEGNSKLYPMSSFSGKLGKGTYIGNRSQVSGNIGRYTSIGMDVKVIQGTHPYTYPYVTTCPAFFSLKKQSGFAFTDIQRFNELLLIDAKNDYSVKIGNDCWIGERAMIIGGIEIGDGAMILAGAVVTKNIPPYAIAGGVPAKVLRYRYNENSIKFLLSFKWWDKNEEWLKENVDLMCNMERFENEYTEKSN